MVRLYYSSMAEGLRDSGDSGVVKARASFSDDITEPSLPRPSHVKLKSDLGHVWTFRMLKCNHKYDCVFREEPFTMYHFSRQNV